MYYVNKIIGWVTSPLGVAFLGLVVGWVLHWRGGRMAFVGKWLVGFAVAFLWLMSCNVTTRFVGVGLERRWTQDGVMHGSIGGVPDADAIIVLGGTDSSNPTQLKGGPGNAGTTLPITPRTPKTTAKTSSASIARQKFSER